MSQTAALILPMIILIFLTFGMMIWMLKQRYRAVLKDGLDPRYFRLYNPTIELPDYLIKVTQHYHNLLEMPLLFYTAILLLVTLDMNNHWYICLAWAFLITRLLHSYIHTTSNKLKWRKNSFIFSMVVLILLWISLAIDVIRLL